MHSFDQLASLDVGLEKLDFDEFYLKCFTHVFWYHVEYRLALYYHGLIHCMQIDFQNPKNFSNAQVPKFLKTTFLFTLKNS